MPTSPLRILIGILLCLFPLLIYCLLLMALNGRRRASIVPGTWDCAGVLLGTSGFVLAGGPLILIGLNSTWRRIIYGGRVSDWRRLSGEGDLQTLILWAALFAAVVIGSVVLVLSRRRTTVIYNADTAHVWSALEWIFGRVGIVWKRQDNTYELRKAREPERLDSNFVSQPASNHIPAMSWLTVRVLPTNCNVTLVWDSARTELREPIERELGTLLTNIRAESNPVNGWLASAATVIVAIMVCSMIFLIVLMINNRTAL